MIFGINLSVAQAAIFDWFTGDSKEASISSTFSFITPFLGLNNQANEDENESKQDGPVLVQNSFIASMGSLIVNKTAAYPTKNTTGNFREIVVSTTAYSSTPDQTDDSPFITALGTRVRDGIIATNFLPFGTKIKIPQLYGDRVFVVEDRMNRRYWYTIDVWFPDRAGALEFGFKVVKIQILES